MELRWTEPVVPPALRRRRWNSQFSSHESIGLMRSVGCGDCDESECSCSSSQSSFFAPATQEQLRL
jgi:hypothetical protein